MASSSTATEGGKTTVLTNTAQAIIDATERLSGAEFLSAAIAKDCVGVVLPNGKRLESIKELLEEFLEKPERRQGTVTLNTVESFVDLVKRYSHSTLSVIFGKRDFKAASLLAVFDYHPSGVSDVKQAEWAEFRARYPFPLSKEWERWFGSKDTAMESPAFAQFVEDNLLDVVAVDEDDLALREFAVKVGARFASPTQLLDMSRSIAINVASSVKQAMTLASGEINISYQEVHADGEGRPIRVPNHFVIGIPIFVDGPRYRIPCKLRYRVNGPKISWSYSMVKPEQSFDDAFKEVCEKVRTDTGLPLFYGSPETAE